MPQTEIPQEIRNGAEALRKQYINSPATTNGGRVFRFVCRFITLDTILKLLANKK